MSGISLIPNVENAVELSRFQTKSGERIIDPRRIIYLSAQLNYTIFHLADGEQVIKIKRRRPCYLFNCEQQLR